MIIDCVSDLHGYYPKLEGGDLLIVAGDLTACDQIDQYLEFNQWLCQQDYTQKIIIAGNHDNYCEIGIPVETLPNQIGVYVPILSDKAVYLQDSGTEFEGLKIWGSPWTKTFEGMNPKCKAFTFDTEEELAEKWALIPDDIDILITHSPPWGVLDILANGESVGSYELRKIVIPASRNKNYLPRIKLHVFGHIHEGYGKHFFLKERIEPNDTIFCNASYVNERYKPVNKPIRVIL